jgi:hypothetical protein
VSKVKQEITVFLSLLVIITLTVFFMLLGYYYDISHSKFPLISKIYPLKEDSNNESIQIMDSKFEAMLDDSLPIILSSSKPQLRDEFKHNHKWLSVIFHYSDSCPRALRVLSLATNIIIMIFIQSIIYNLANPDDRYCKNLTSMLNCEKLRSQMNSKESKCKWEIDIMLKNGGRCNFNQSTSSWTVIMLITLFSAVASTPIVLFLNYIIFDILAAKFKDGTMKTEDRIRTKSIISIINRQHVESDSMLVFHQFKTLSDEILLHRRNLSRIDLLDFDRKIFLYSLIFIF